MTPSIADKIVFEGGTAEERKIVLDSFAESGFPWAERLNQNIRIEFHPGVAASGRVLPTGNVDYLRGAIDHELGHLFDAYILTWDGRFQFSRRVCTHDPRHGWNQNSTTPWHLSLAEDFANAYAALFHAGGEVQFAGHETRPGDTTWVRNLMLSQNPDDDIWI